MDTLIPNYHEMTYSEIRDYVIKTFHVPAEEVPLEDPYDDEGNVVHERIRVPKRPYNSCWSAIWPGRYCFYRSWKEVKADLEESIKVDMEGYGEPLDYVCMYLDYEHASTNWIHIYMLN